MKQEKIKHKFGRFLAITVAASLTIFGENAICYGKDSDYEDEVVSEEIQETETDAEPTVLTEESSIMKQHSEIEKELLEWYEGTDEKTLDTAVVHQDIYEMAPLTAVVLFETEQPEKISVTVHGKTPDCDITYETDQETHHEIQIFGLYAGYENTVTLQTESGDSRDFVIETDPLPEVMTKVTKTVNQGDQPSDRLFYVCDKWRTIYDKNGDVRWYMDGITAAFSGIDEIDLDNHRLWFSTEGSSSNMASVYCVSLTGRLLGRYFILGKSAHHDATLLPNGRLMYLSKWRTPTSELGILDPETGSFEVYMDPQDLFDDTIGSLEYQTREDEWDFLHANAVEYIPDNNCLLLSFRNQHTIMAMDYDTHEVKWVVTPAYQSNENGEVKAIQEAFSDCLIYTEDGDDFEWFYSQHSPKLVSYDAENDIYDITVFDNGTNRYLASESGNAGLNEEKYSRLVRYQIDVQNGVIRQVYQFGQDHPEFYSDQCGSAQYLSEENRYIANFPGMEDEAGDRVSYVTESDEYGNEIAEYTLENIPDGSYRTIACKTQNFVVTSNVIGSPEEYLEVFKHDGNKWTAVSHEPSETGEVYSVKEIVLTENGLTIRGSATEIKGKGKLKFRFLAIDSCGNQYQMPLVCYRGNRFYMPGIDMSSLPKDEYHLAIYMELNKKPYGYKTIPYIYNSKDAALENAEAEKNTEKTESSVFTLIENTTNWNFEILDIEKQQELKTVIPVTQYDLSIDNVEYLNKAGDDKMFLLLNVKVSKNGSGSGAFSWKDVTLTDEEGNVYTRMDDVFLEDHSYNRMAGTDIKMGSKSGWICFEVDRKHIDDEFTFEFQGKNNTVLVYSLK